MKIAGRPAHVGLFVGAVFGCWNLLVTWLDPLADDTPATLLLFYGPMFLIWGVGGFFASRRTGRLIDGPRVGATLAFFTFLAYIVTQFVRVNLFLEEISHRSDWQNLMVRFQSSGFENLRSYVNYVGLTGAPFKILVATTIGGLLGLIGGAPGTKKLSRTFARSH